jgi:hypothetical protein
MNKMSSRIFVMQLFFLELPIILQLAFGQLERVKIVSVLPNNATLNA